jgi:hypothetical protein
MSNGTDLANFPSVIGAVKTPLGFLTLIALVLDTGMLGAAVITEGKAVPGWMPAGLLVLLLILIFAIVMINPLALYHPSEWPPARSVTVSLIFPSESVPSDFNEVDSTLEVRDKQGHKRRSPPLQLVFGPGGWTMRLDENVVDSDSVRVELVDHDGNEWIVRPFAAYHTEVRPELKRYNSRMVE